MPASDRSRSPRYDHYDMIIIGSGAGGGTLARELAATSARMLIIERGDFVPESRRTGIRAKSGSTCATAPPTGGSTSAASRSSRTHTTTLAATRSSGAACCTGCGGRTSRGRHRDGVSPAWPIDYNTLEPYYERAERDVPGARRGGRRPDGGRPSPFPQAPVPHAAGMTSIVAQLRRLVCIHRPCPSVCSSRAKRAAACCATPATPSPARCGGRATPRCAASCRPRERERRTGDECPGDGGC